ncbi:MAG TPA: cysteine peptidase family C39 domain-containing protein [Sphingomicrobium sp.]|nr:cysteine peptidase family C39 domain-containing protein [Sphingomicrobium sp.]
MRAKAHLLLSLAMAASSAWSQAAGAWIDVPFVGDRDQGCGAASILMVMEYWQRQLGRPSGELPDLGQIELALLSPEARGIYASDLERYLREHAFETRVFRGDDMLLEHHLRKGRPLIVALKPTARPLLHYVVVAGIDPLEKVWLVNDPAERKLLKIDSRDFLKKWQATDHWTLLAVPRSNAR